MPYGEVLAAYVLRTGPGTRRVRSAHRQVPSSYYRDLHGVVQLGALKKVELLAADRGGRKAGSPELLHRVPDHTRRAADHGCPVRPVVGLGSHRTDKPRAPG